MQLSKPLKPPKAESLRFNVQFCFINLSTEKANRKVAQSAFAEIIMILRNEEEKANCQRGNDM
jgi:hypothetical protein